MKKAFLPLIALVPLAFAAPASAAGVAPAGIERANQTQLIQVADRRHRSNRHRRVHRHHHYRPGHRYRSAPHGWHRYHHRPHDWRTRGCIIVGPIWFCP